MVNLVIMDTIGYDDFKKLDLRVAKILEYSKHNAKVFWRRIMPRFAPTNPLGRRGLAGIATVYVPEVLVGKQIVIVANLEPKIIRGVESNGMLLAASDELGPVLLIPESEVKSGAEIK